MPFPLFQIFTSRVIEHIFAAMGAFSETLRLIFSPDFLMDQTVDLLIFVYLFMYLFI
jgi:hypothetical protein